MERRTKAVHVYITKGKARGCDMKKTWRGKNNKEKEKKSGETLRMEATERRNKKGLKNRE